MSADNQNVENSDNNEVGQLDADHWQNPSRNRKPIESWLVNKFDKFEPSTRTEANYQKHALVMLDPKREECGRKLLSLPNPQHR